MGLSWPTIPDPGPDVARGANLVHVQVLLPHATDVWDGALWDVGTWDANTPSSFLDVSCYVDGISIERGRKDPIGHIEPGRCAFNLDNDEGLFTPWNTLDPDGRDLGYPLFGPGIPVRVATYAGDLFVGLVTQVAETDDTDWPVVGVAAVDPLSLAAESNQAALADVGAGDLAGARMTRIFDRARLPGWVDRNWSTGGRVGLQATSLAAEALTEAWLTADSDGGILFATRSGVIRYLNSLELEGPAWTEPVAMIADHPDTASMWDVPLSVYCPASYTFTATRDAVVNRVSIACTGGTAFIAEDAGSIGRNGVRTTQRHDLIYQTAAQATHGPWLAANALDRLAHAEVILSPIEGFPTDDDDWWTLAHTLDMHHRLEVARHRWDQELRVLGTVDNLAHRITPGVDTGDPGKWVMTIKLSPGSQLAGWSRWDAAVWDYSPWDLWQ